MFNIKTLFESNIKGLNTKKLSWQVYDINELIITAEDLSSGFSAEFVMGEYGPSLQLKSKEEITWIPFGSQSSLSINSPLVGIKLGIVTLVKEGEYILRLYTIEELKRFEAELASKK